MNSGPKVHFVPRQSYRLIYFYMQNAAVLCVYKFTQRPLPSSYLMIQTSISRTGFAGERINQLEKVKQEDIYGDGNYTMLE